MVDWHLKVIGGGDDLQEYLKLASHERMQVSCLREIKGVLLKHEERWFA